jgi:hypothetical protein
MSQPLLLSPERSGRAGGTLDELAAGQAGCVNARQLKDLGWSKSQVDWRVRSHAWRALLPGVYLIAGWAYGTEWDGLPFATRLWATRLLHGPDCVFCLETAARLRGIQGLRRDDGIVHVRLRPGNERHQYEGVCIHPRLVAPEDITAEGPWLLTSPARTVLDLVLSLPRVNAISVLDSSLHLGLLTKEEIPRLQLSAKGRRGAAISRPWWALADGRAESPLETRVRLIAIDAGHPPDELQLPIHDAFGILLGFGDLAWKRPQRRTMVVEADGEEPHERPKALFRDRYRANDFAATGSIDLFRVTWRDVERPTYLVSLLRTNLAP